MKENKITIFEAWSAGFIDGEGYISEHKVKGKAYYFLKINQCNLLPLEKMKECFGGSIYKRPKWDSAWEYTLQGKKLLPLLKKITPILTVKKEKAEVALNFLKNKYPHLLF